MSPAEMFLTSASRGGQETVAQAIMLRQLMRLAQNVKDASDAATQERLAKLAMTDPATRLVHVREASLKGRRIDRPTMVGNRHHGSRGTPRIIATRCRCAIPINRLVRESFKFITEEGLHFLE